MSVDVVRSAAGRLLARLGAIEARLAADEGGVDLLPDLTAAMDECLATLAGTNLWGRANEIPSSELWRIAGPVLGRGWMQDRARSKPRGYAGDFQLLGRMIRNELCADSLGRLFDRYFQNLAAPGAVCNRSELVRQWIVERVVADPRVTQVVVVGCGPACDVEQAALSLAPEQRSRLAVRLLDYDPQAVEAAESRLRPLLRPENLRCEAGSLFRIPERAKMGAWLDGANLLISVGMFDYLDDSQAARMLATFWERTAPGGEVAVFNFSPANTSRAYMEWIGNWYLIYRDELQMRQLAAAAGIPASQVEVGSEPLGIDLFLRIHKPAG